MALRKSSRVLVLASVLAPLFAAPTSAFALDGQSVNVLSHMMECAGLLLTDPAKHKELCLAKIVSAEQLSEMLNAADEDAGPTEGTPVDSSSLSS